MVYHLCECLLLVYALEANWGTHKRFFDMSKILSNSQEILHAGESACECDWTRFECATSFCEFLRVGSSQALAGAHRICERSIKFLASFLSCCVYCFLYCKCGSYFTWFVLFLRRVCFDLSQELVHLVVT